MSTAINESNIEEDCFIDQIQREIQNGPTTRARKAFIRTKLQILLNRASLESPQPVLSIANTECLPAPINSESSRNVRFRQILDDLSAWDVWDDQISLNSNNERKDINEEIADNDQDDYWEELFAYVDEEDGICLNDWDSVCEVKDFDDWEEIRQHTEGLIKVMEIKDKDEDCKF